MTVQMAQGVGRCVCVLNVCAMSMSALCPFVDICEEGGGDCMSMLGQVAHKPVISFLTSLLPERKPWSLIRKRALLLPAKI